MFELEFNTSKLRICSLCHLPSTAASALTDIDLSTCELSPTQQQQLLALLQDYADLFATAGGPLERTSVVRHAIYTDGHVESISNKSAREVYSPNLVP